MVQKQTLPFLLVLSAALTMIRPHTEMGHQEVLPSLPQIFEGCGLSPGPRHPPKLLYWYFSEKCTKIAARCLKSQVGTAQRQAEEAPCLLFLPSWC